MYMIPIYSEVPFYNYDIDLDGSSYNLKLRWNYVNKVWYMDIKGTSNSVDMKAIALLPGCGLLEAFALKELGELIVVDTTGYNAKPEYDSFGKTHKLVYLTVQEIRNASF